MREKFDGCVFISFTVEFLHQFDRFVESKPIPGNIRSWLLGTYALVTMIEIFATSSSPRGGGGKLDGVFVRVDRKLMYR